MQYLPFRTEKLYHGLPQEKENLFSDILCVATQQILLYFNKLNWYYMYSLVNFITLLNLRENYNITVGPQLSCDLLNCQS